MVDIAFLIERSGTYGDFYIVVNRFIRFIIVDVDIIRPVISVNQRKDAERMGPMRIYRYIYPVSVNFDTGIEVIVITGDD